MALSLPAHGQHDWDGQLNSLLSDHEDRIAANDSALVGKETPAGAQAKADAAQTAAIAASEPLTVGGKRAVRHGEITIHVDSFTGTDSARLAAACSSATTLGGEVLLPDRVLDVGNGFSMSGYSCGIRGRFAGWGGGGAGAPKRSVIKASTQTGPVLDFTGFTWPSGFRGALQFSNFSVQGSGAADATKVNAGIALPFQAGAGVGVWRNIVISNTGGPCFTASGLYLHTFENVRLYRPVGAKTNNVPYFYGANVTQCDINIDLYSPDAVGASDDCGVGGAFVCEDDGSFASTMNRINIRSENIHMPTNGTMISYAGNDSTIELRQSDCKMETGATETSFIRLKPPAVQDFGGNSIIGVIRGSNGSTPICTVGNDILQSRNRIVGAKGFKGNNVRLASGVGYTFIALQGAHSGATDAGVIDNSGQTTNTILDYVTYPGTGIPAPVGQVVHALCVAGVWQPRPTTSTSVMCIFLSPALADGAPPDFIDGHDVLLQPTS